MKVLRFLLVYLIVSMVAISCYSQRPILPTSLPSPNNKGYQKIGYVQPDSGILFSSRDTNWTPKYPALVLWQHAGVDTSFWGYDGTSWKRSLANVSGGIGSVVWADGFSVYDNRYASITHVHSFGSLTGKPTSLAGYGIIDPVLLSTTAYPDPSWITSLSWSKIIGRPTTIAGYGITDGFSVATGDSRYPQLTGAYPNPSWITSLSWSKITTTPTTLSGYGITDAMSLATADGRYSQLSHTHSFASLTSKPTTIAGYGIADPIELTTNKVNTLSSPNSTTYPTSSAVATGLGAKMDSSVHSHLYVVWPLRQGDDSTIVESQADATHDGYQDSLNYSHSEQAYNTVTNGGNLGDISVASNVWTINNLAVTDAKINSMTATKLTGTVADARLSTNVVQLTTTQTLSNKRWVARVGSTTSSATPTINTDNIDIYKLTAQAVDITSFTTNLSGTPNDGDVLEIQITGTASRAISWGTSFVSSTVTLPTTTTTTATLTIVFQYYTTSSYGNNKWVCVNYY